MQVIAGVNSASYAVQCLHLTRLENQIMINKKQVIKELADSLQSRGINLPKGELITLLEIARSLHSWQTHACNDLWYCEDLDVYVHRDGHAVEDKSMSLRVKLYNFQKRNDLYWFIQTDPRGWPLYISDSPISDRDYSTQAVGVCPHASNRGTW